ncbi:hypothetical protein [Williamsia sp. CHRR-6]|uniref:hypothetical protein n=1 Tax=Williamsia sp. CHRR-6 TaxID=2835871 RepID=UPI001BDAADEC|nr:hypothetical protein [Williamsia sp. CHRR-6]MBT0565958.1 hypothetical protein [Williamsia sp. CHRR-6]
MSGGNGGFTVIYLLALIGAVAVIYLVWKAFGPQTTTAPTRRGPIGPDDDPDFLLDLGRSEPTRPQRPTTRPEGSGPHAGPKTPGSESTPPSTPPPTESSRVEDESADEVQRHDDPRPGAS